MIKFINDQYYRTTEVIELGQRGLFPVKTMVTLNKLIRSGRIPFINIGVKERPTYRIKGEHLNKFLNEYEGTGTGVQKQTEDTGGKGT